MVRLTLEMEWNNLNKLTQLDEVKKESFEKPVLIFKYSTRCSTSRMVFDRLQRNWNEDDGADVKPYFLDLLVHREISNSVAARYDVPHESPQVLIIRDDRSIYDESHFAIDFQSIRDFLKNEKSRSAEQKYAD